MGGSVQPPAEGAADPAPGPERALRGAQGPNRLGGAPLPRTQPLPDVWLGGGVGPSLPASAAAGASSYCSHFPALDSPPEAPFLTTINDLAKSRQAPEEGHSYPLIPAN